MKDAAFAGIRDRERLYGILLQHDPDGTLPQFTARDMSILRQIATEGPLTNHVPEIRRRAIILLANSPTPENLELLGDLAIAGEDFYVRSYALLALGQTGLKLTAPLLCDALSATEFDGAAGRGSRFTHSCPACGPCDSPAHCCRTNGMTQPGRPLIAS